jgi:hypothetical protein
MSSNWPFYKDNSIFGENYGSMIDITSTTGGEHTWQSEVSDIVHAVV